MIDLLHLLKLAEAEDLTTDQGPKAESIRWTGNNFDEIAALGRGGACMVSITAYRDDLWIKNLWDSDRQHAKIGDVIQRLSLGELRVVKLT